MHGTSFAMFLVKSLSFISVTLIGDWISEPTVSKARRLLGVCIVMIAIIFAFYEELCTDKDDDGKVDSDACDVAFWFHQSQGGIPLGFGWGLLRHTKSAKKQHIGLSAVAAILGTVAAVWPFPWSREKESHNISSSSSSSSSSLVPPSTSLSSVVVDCSKVMATLKAALPKEDPELFDTELLYSLLMKERIFSVEKLVQLTEQDLRGQPFALNILAARSIRLTAQNQAKISIQVQGASLVKASEYPHTGI